MRTIPDSVPDYERSDANIGLITALGAGLAAFLIGAPLALRFIYPASINLGEPKPPAVAAGPRLQVDPQADLARFRRDEDKHLNGYAWSDNQRQTAHIPIDRAMSLLVKRGLPGWPR